MNYDIAIVELHSELKFNETVKPIQLADANDGLPIDGTPAIVSGWGYTTDAGHPPSSLKSVKVSVADRKKCVDRYHKLAVFDLTANMFCVGKYMTEEGACQGDSGGALVDLKTNKQIGIVSSGVGCSLKELPDIYASVSVLRGFITKVTKI